MMFKATKDSRFKKSGPTSQAADQETEAMIDAAAERAGQDTNRYRELKDKIEVFRLNLVYARIFKDQNREKELISEVRTYLTEFLKKV